MMSKVELNNLQQEARETFPRRVMAGLVDIVIVIIIWSVAAVFLGEERIIERSGEPLATGYGWKGMKFFLSLLALWPYWFLSEAIWGATPGKALFGLRVTTTDGEKCSLKSIFVRNLVRPIDGLPFLYIAGFLFSLGNPYRKRMGDALANTIVVSSGSKDKTLQA